MRNRIKTLLPYKELEFRDSPQCDRWVRDLKIQRDGAHAKLMKLCEESENANIARMAQHWQVLDGLVKDLEGEQKGADKDDED